MFLSECLVFESWEDLRVSSFVELKETRVDRAKLMNYRRFFIRYRSLRVLQRVTLPYVYLNLFKFTAYLELRISEVAMTSLSSQ